MIKIMSNFLRNAHGRHLIHYTLMFLNKQVKMYAILNKMNDFERTDPMRIAAIIAEYNPLHNGHAYHLQKTKALTGADAVIVLMSGDFMQRGTPAIVNKYSRAACALDLGADLVLELPALWATSSADLYAHGAIAILNGLDCVDALCFGAECEDTQLLTEIADLMAKNPPELKPLLQTHIKKGLTFPAARAAARGRDFLPAACSYNVC